MKSNIAITNCRYGRLTAVKRVENDKYNHKQWLCRCACGNEIVVLQSSLISGRTRSCGCYYKDTRQTSARTHGQSKTRLFHIWTEMLARCKYQSRNDYQYYGGKGIKVCEEWQAFENFAKWAQENGYTENLTIDRIDTDGDYTPANCRWATRQTQMNNTTRNRVVTVNGVSKTLAEWSRENKIKYHTIQDRLARGWNETDAVTKQVKRKSK